jgi:hypothetical protein
MGRILLELRSRFTEEQFWNSMAEHMPKMERGFAELAMRAAQEEAV